MNDKKRVFVHNTQLNPPAWLAGVVAACFVLTAGCQALKAQAQAAEPRVLGADATTSSAEQEDGIITKWEQHWTVDKDGTVHRREHKLFKYLNSRPIRATADPRLDYNDTTDELIIHTAQTHLPNGTVLPVPDYSRNVVGPDDVAGWPAYKDWRQIVVSFGGIEDNAVTDLDYEVVTRPGVLPWIDADLRLDDDYSVSERIVKVTLPANHPRPKVLITNIQQEAAQRAPTTSGGMTTYTWTWKDLPNTRDEPQSPGWHHRCARLLFSTCPGGNEWVKTILDAAEHAAKPGDAVRHFAKTAIEDEPDPKEQVRLVAKKLHDSFNLVDSHKAMRDLSCRPAEEVLKANYGNQLEAGALLAAAIRSLDIPASLMVAVDAEIMEENVPTGSAFAGLVAAAPLADETVYVHPGHGIIRNPGSWGKHRLLAIDERGSVRDVYVWARGEKKPSQLRITGKIKIADDAKPSGELRLHLTGACYDPADLENAGAQESLIKGLVGRVLSDANVSSHSVTTLSDELLRATANMASKESLKEVAGQHVIKLGDGPAFLASFPLPLDRSYRRTDVQLRGAFTEYVDISIEIPEGWKASILPNKLPKASGSWGSLHQQVEADGQTIRLRRVVTVTKDRLTPGEFGQLREAVNHLRAAQSLLIALEH
jgi:hypothetical protein